MSVKFILLGVVLIIIKAIFFYFSIVNKITYNPLMEYRLKSKKGVNIRLKGVAQPNVNQCEQPDLFALRPIDFPSLTPKVIAKPGMKVKIGTTVFFDKKNPSIKFVSPISGTVSDILRGEKRKILQINIQNDHKNETEVLPNIDLDTISREALIEYLCESGLWPFIQQRPYGVFANPSETPKSIFISFFDSAPLAPDLEFLMADKTEILIKAISCVAKLTDGPVYLGFKENSSLKKNFSSIDNTNIITISGPHPAGNVGTLINKYDPINKDEIIWTLNPQALLHIGDTISKGHFSAERTIALVGSEVKTPAYYQTYLGSAVSSFISNQLNSDNVRVISGNVLTGKNIGKDGVLGFVDTHVSIIPEGNHHEFFGWLLPGLKKFSVSKTFITYLFPKKKYVIDTNLHGGRRAFVVTGEYEKVCPIDILPQHLIKAIIIKDIDKMEQLGIYEVVEEDMALCEFVCTSKIEVQAILRQGLDMMREEMS